MSVVSDAAAAAGPDVTPGTVPAWAVTFLNEVGGEQLAVVGSDTYDGSVSATLPADLTGGTYQVVIEGMTDEDYGRIHATGRSPLAAVIHLWWKDAPTGVLGDLARSTGLDQPLGAITPDPPPFSRIAVIRVDRLWRRPGARRVEVVASGRELVVAKLSDTQADPKPQPDLRTAVAEITGAAKVFVRQYGLGDIQPPPNSRAPVSSAVAIPPGTALSALTSVLEKQARPLLQLFGQPLAVIRDGVLHVGVWASAGTGPSLPVLRNLDDDSGLLAVERGSSRQREQVGDRTGAPQSRVTLSVTTLGRPDLKPGDTVLLPLPPEDFPKVEPPSIGGTLLRSLPIPPFGDLGPDPDPTPCRVTGVSHRVSREEGFITVVQAFALASGDDGWDLGGLTPAREARTAPPVGVPSSDPAQAFATILRSTTSTLTADLTAQARSHVALVHDHAAPDGALHTSEIWFAVTGPDGRAGTAQRAQITPELHGEGHVVPYATPFAWGNYGLVLPRYPGTRVLLVDGAGAPGEYVDAGAIWDYGSGPRAAPGDYWLALPVGIADREHLPDGSSGEPTDGPATHDLIDADGTRVIETSRFVLRVTDQLTQSPGRPEPGDDAAAGSVLIETRSSSSGKSAQILLKDDGTVTITATSITFDTAGQGDIELKAKNVKVELSGGTMDVS